MSDYIPTEKFTHAKTYYGRGGKFERPQVLIVEDKPAYLYAPAGTNIQGGTGTASYVLKFIFDLTD